MLSEIMTTKKGDLLGLYGVKVYDERQGFQVTQGSTKTLNFTTTLPNNFKMLYGLVKVNANNFTEHNGKTLVFSENNGWQNEKQAFKTGTNSNSAWVTLGIGYKETTPNQISFYNHGEANEHIEINRIIIVGYLE